MVKGNGCVINAVEIAEFSFKRGMASPIEAKYVYLNSNDSMRYGSGTINSWSDATKKALDALLESMENDISSMVFTVPTTTDSAKNEIDLPPDEVPGL